MGRFTGIAIALAFTLPLVVVYAQQKDTPLTDDEKLATYNILGTAETIALRGQQLQQKIDASEIGKQIAELQRKFQELQAKLHASDLGKQQEQLQKEMQEANDIKNRKIKALQESHGAAGKCLGPTLLWTDPGVGVFCAQ